VAGHSEQTRDRVNILLPVAAFESDNAVGLKRGGPDGQWGKEDYASARMAAEELESLDLAPEDADAGLVQEVLRALAGHDQMRGAMAAAGMDVTAESASYVTPADLEGVGPPPGMPLYVPENGLLSVPAVGGGAQAVQAAVQRVRDGIQAEPALVYRAISAALTVEATGQDALAYPAEQVSDGEVEPEQAWFEAALELGAAAQVVPWGVARVNAPRAWALGFRGQGIRVAVVDTGVGPHIDLAPPLASATFVPGSTSANDNNGHGTHVAGTVAALYNTTGVVGVAPRAQLLRAKVLDRNGTGSDAQVAAGFVWAANHGARIINLSLGGGFSATIQRALIFARSRRVAICAAAGNNSTPTTCAPVIYPARDPLCIAVAATDPANRKAVFSCCGAELDVAAPGVNVLSSFPGNAYRALNGTSMATPHVSGLAALVLSRAPGLDPARLERHLERTAIALGPAAQFGRGLVQADRAVTMPISLGRAERNGATNGQEVVHETTEMVEAISAGQRGRRR
jgi:subtilisin